MPSDRFKSGDRLCEHCEKGMAGAPHGWQRCPVCDHAIHTLCMNSHLILAHADHWRGVAARRRT